MMPKIFSTFTALILSTLALIFSGWNAFFSDSVFCLTSSCHVLSDFAIFGFSLWLYSFIFFVLINALLFTKKAFLAFIFLAIGLIADIALLGLMLITAPCFNCLIIGLLIALTFLVVAYTKPLKKISFAFLCLWTALFIINAGAIAKTLVNPYTIYINPAYQEDVYSSSMRIFFSPSCSACKQAVDALGSEEMTIEADIAWIPVPESREDIVLILQLERLIAKGMNLKDALDEVVLNPQNSTLDTLLPELFLQTKLLVNQSLLNQRGTNRIPFVEYTGLPAHIANMKNEEDKEGTNMLEILRKMSPYAIENKTTQTKPEVGVGAFCDHTTEEDC